jgi:hypothetical protein
VVVLRVLRRVVGDLRGVLRRDGLVVRRELVVLREVVPRLAVAAPLPLLLVVAMSLYSDLKWQKISNVCLYPAPEPPLQLHALVYGS